MNAIVKNSYQYPGLFNNFFGKDLMDDLFVPTFKGTAPAVNVVENENGFRVEVAAPGFQKADFKLNLEGNRLTISSEKEQKEDEKSEKYTRREFAYVSFQRTFTLPTSVDAEKIGATYQDGILVVELPRKEEAKVKPNRSIDIA
jgi:HSP20 family protein